MVVPLNLRKWQRACGAILRDSRKVMGSEGAYDGAEADRDGRVRDFT